jgi:hypothetical protein
MVEEVGISSAEAGPFASKKWSLVMPTTISVY